MIIELFLTAIYKILDIMLFINIPALPETVHGYIETMFDYLSAGAGILANYTPFGYLIVLFGILLAVDAGIMIYHFVMWVLRKIPLAGIS